MNAEIIALIGFLIAAYAIVANDAIQTLGTFLSSNSNRPWWVLWLYAGSVLLIVFLYSWFRYDGDVTYGRLEKFPEPAGGLTWLHVIPPVVVLVLTRFGIPVSTTFLVLTMFAPSNMGGMLTKSLMGYLVAFVLGLLVYRYVAKTLEKRWIDSPSDAPGRTWVALQWCSTGFLWSLWLMHDLANIFVYLPRRLSIAYLVFAAVTMLVLHAIMFAFRGGEIQKIVLSKTNTTDIRSATVVDFLYAFILLFFKELNNMPMSTTWVFLGLLAGREIAITLNSKQKSLKATGKLVLSDGAKAGIGLAISVLLAIGLPGINHSLNEGSSLTASEPVTITVEPKGAREQNAAREQSAALANTPLH